MRISPNFPDIIFDSDDAMGLDVKDVYEVLVVSEEGAYHCI